MHRGKTRRRLHDETSFRTIQREQSRQSDWESRKKRRNKQSPSTFQDPVRRPPGPHKLNSYVCGVPMFKAVRRPNIPQKRKAEIPSRNSFPNGPTRAKPTVTLGKPKEEKEQAVPSSLRNRVRWPPRPHKLNNCKCGVLMFEAVQRALCTAEK